MGFDFSAMLDEDTRRKVEEDAVVDAVYAGSEMSLETVNPKFRDLFIGVDAMVARANSMVVVDETSHQEATAMIGDAKRLWKKIEKKRDEICAPYSGFVSSMKNFCAAVTVKLVKFKKDDVGSVEDILKQKIDAYTTKVELERRKKEEEARRVAAELQKKLDAEAAEANRKAREEAARKAEEEARKNAASQAEIEAAKKAAEEEAAKHAIKAPTVPDPVVPKSTGPVRAENGSTSYSVKTWTCTIVDPSLVPREFCAPVQRLLNDAVKQGVRAIPGCEIKEETSVRVRC